MKYNQLVIVSISALLISACSNKTLYEAIQENRVNDCRNLSYQKEQTCLNDLNQKPYDEYKRQLGDEDTNKTHADASFSHESIYSS